MFQFVFCHGWGFNRHFWDPLAAYFAVQECVFMDLGYLGCPLLPPARRGNKIIGVGHSLGLLKLVHQYKDFDALIGLGSFVSFLGRDPGLRSGRASELKALRQSFLKDPRGALKAFYKRCGVPGFGDEDSPIDLKLILSDLELLKNDHALPCVPTLILASADDTVVPPELVQDNFSGQSSVELQFIGQGGHGLGFNQPDEVYKKIGTFLNDAFTP